MSTDTDIVLSDLTDAAYRNAIQGCIDLIRDCETVEQATLQLEQFLAMNKEVL